MQRFRARYLSHIFLWFYLPYPAMPPDSINSLQDYLFLPFSLFLVLIKVYV